MGNLHTPSLGLVDQVYDIDDVLEAIVIDRFVAGVHPVGRTKRLERVRRDAPLLPAGATPTRAVKSGNGRQRMLVEGDGWLLLVTRYTNAVAELVVTADTDAIAKRVLDDVSRDACEPPSDETVPVAFWNRGARCPNRASRQIAAPVWAAVRHNYGATVAAAFDRLSVLDPSAVNGRLLLLHGPPGTGKTTALRALASAWRGWCNFEVVVDTEKLFGDAGYLMSVLLGDDDDDDEDAPPRAPRWRMLVLEDCDELLRADAKKETGQALSRLLNVTDGFLGQGLRVFVALSTNEPLSKLHPAIVRPGRCVAEVHVDKLTRAEAAKWLGDGYAAPAHGATLAELYALVEESGPVRAPEEVRPTGTYL